MSPATHLPGDRDVCLSQLTTVGLPMWLSDKRIHLPMQETPVQSLGWEDPLEEGMATHSNILLGKSHGQRSQADYSPCGSPSLT